jgi:hypothetical protein
MSPWARLLQNAAAGFCHVVSDLAIVIVRGMESNESRISVVS